MTKKYHPNIPDLFKIRLEIINLQKKAGRNSLLYNLYILFIFNLDHIAPFSDHHCRLSRPTGSPPLSGESKNYLPVLLCECSLYPTFFPWSGLLNHAC